MQIADEHPLLWAQATGKPQEDWFRGPVILEIYLLQAAAMRKKPKVLVVGGGFAGRTAARLLQVKGHLKRRSTFE